MSKGVWAFILVCSFMLGSSSQGNIESPSSQGNIESPSPQGNIESPSPQGNIEFYSEEPYSPCEPFTFSQELPVYKDPKIIRSNLSRFKSKLESEKDKSLAWKSLFHEGPLISSVKGRVYFRHQDPREFENFGAVARLFELADPRLKVRRNFSSNYYEKGDAKFEKSPLIVPVIFCEKGGAYEGTPGFALLKDFQKAQEQVLEGGSLPPSTYPNPIPKLRKTEKN